MAEEVSILNNTTNLLETVYGVVKTRSVADDDSVDHIFMKGTKRQIALRTPFSHFSNRKDPFYDYRLAITDGEYMNTIHNLYDAYAIFAGHTFGAFRTYVDEQRVERKLFSMVKEKSEATHVYREIIWKRPSSSPELASQRLKNSHLYDYCYSCRLSDNAGMVGGVDIAVMPIVRGLEGLVADYFEKMYQQEIIDIGC